MLFGHKQAHILSRFEQHSRRNHARRVACLASTSKAAPAAHTPVPPASSPPEAAVAPRAPTTEKDDWADVVELLREKGYEDETAAASAWKEVLSKEDFDPAVVLNNVVALSLIIQNPADVKYLMREEPRILMADLLAWAGLLHSLHLTTSFLLNASPTIFVDTAAADCMPTIQHLLRHNPDQKALGQKVKRHPALLTLTKGQLDATESAFRDLGLKPAPMRMLLGSRPAIYLQHCEAPAAYIAEVREAVHALKEYGIEPNEVLPEVSGIVARAHPGRSIREKLESLRKLGLEAADVGRIVSAAPTVLLLSCAELQRKWSYLRVVLNGGRQQLLEYPEFLLLQFSRDIAPAYAFLVQNSQQHRVRGSTDGSISLELLAREARDLRKQPNYVDFVSKWKCDMRR